MVKPYSESITSHYIFELEVRSWKTKRIKCKPK